MTNKDDKKKQELLRQQQEADRLERQKLMTTAATPPPLENTLTNETQNWFDVTSGKNGPLDIYNLKALKPSLGLFNAASRRQQGERYGIGALAMGAQNTNPGLGQLLRQQSEDQRQQDAAGQLENAYRLTDAQMRGQAFPLMNQAQGRNLNLAGLSNSNSANSTNMFTQFTPRPSIWAQLANSAVQGAAGAATSWATGGLSGLGSSGGGLGSLLHEQGHSFARGGRWDKYLDQPVEVAENGDELQVADDGTVTLFRGRQQVVPQKPGVVVPAPLTRQLLSRDNFSYDDSDGREGQSPDRMSGVASSPILTRGPVVPNTITTGPEVLTRTPPQSTETIPIGPPLLTRSTQAEPRDTLGDPSLQLRELLTRPVEHTSRKKAIGLGLLRGMAAGSSNGPGGMVGGGLAGMVAGAVAPGRTALLTREDEISKARRNLQTDLLTRKAESDLLGAEADRNYKSAQTDYMRQRPDIEAAKVTNEQSRVQDAHRRILAGEFNRRDEFDPTDPANKELVDAMHEVGLPVVPKKRGSKLQFIQDAKSGGWSVIAGDQTTGGATAQPVNAPGNQPLTTTSPSQMSSDTQNANRQSRERIATANRQSREFIASTRPTRQQTDRRMSQAQQALQQFEELRGKAIYATPDKKRGALANLKAKQSAIDNTFGDLIETGTGTDGTPYAKLRAQSVSQPQGPQGSQGRLSEQQIRDYARQRGLDPDTLVDRARKHGDLPPQ